MMGFLVLSLGVGVWLGMNRFQFESIRHHVDTVVSAREMTELALRSAIDETWLLNQVRQMGITSISVEEATLEELSKKGDASLFFGPQRLFVKPLLFSEKDLKGGSTLYVAFSETSHINFYEKIMRLQWGARVKRVGASVLAITGDFDDILRTGLGIPQSVVDRYQALGFGIIPRLKFNSVWSDAVLTEKLDVFGPNIHLVIFEGDKVLGYPKKIGEMAKQLKSRHLMVGSIEFSEQLGASELSHRLFPEVVRVHSLTESEMQTVSPAKAITRYVRAVRERNSGVILLHPYQLTDGTGFYAYNRTYFEGVLSSLTQFGFSFSKTSESMSYKGYHPPAGSLFLVLTWGLLAALWLFILTHFSKMGRPLVIGSFGIATFLWLFAEGTHQLLLFNQTMALLAAMLFPAWGVIGASKWSDATQHRGLIKLLISMGIACGITALGALFVIAFLSDATFAAGVRHFMGVKLAFVVPFLVIIFYEGYSQSKQSPVADLRRLWAKPLTVGLLLVTGVLTGVFALYLIRSGNASPASVSSFELKTRDLLESLLWVRPRTKEFLIGYPCLVLAFMLRKTIRWRLVLKLVGSVALVSGLNSFCHVHTPLVYSAYRGFLGMVLGVLIGAILMVLIKQYFRKIA